MRTNGPYLEFRLAIDELQMIGQLRFCVYSSQQKIISHTKEQKTK